MELHLGEPTKHRAGKEVVPAVCDILGLRFRGSTGSCTCYVRKMCINIACIVLNISNYVRITCGYLGMQKQISEMSLALRIAPIQPVAHCI